MCGIAGYIVTKDGVVRKKSLKRLAVSLLINIASRGKEAAGYAYIHPQTGFVRIAKAGVSPMEFIKIPGHLLSNGDYRDMPRMMILHARFATQGSPTINGNNHPLYTKGSGLCMVHNGWFTNEDIVAKEMKLDCDFDVDSEVYLKLIEQYFLAGDGLETAIEKATNKLEVTSACAMFQAKRRDQLWLWRDKFGSLSVAKTEFGYVFASTTAILLQTILSTLSALDSTELKLVSLPPGGLLLLNQDGINMETQLKLDPGEFYWTTEYTNGTKQRKKVSKTHVYTSGQGWSE